MASETVVITPRLDTGRQEHSSSVVKSGDESLANLGTVHGSAKPQSTGIDTSAITPKSIWSLSNEYLLIGIIIGLITIILMLIVYIVKIKQAVPQQTDATGPPPRHLHNIARMQQLGNKTFTPRSQVKIEPVPDRDDTEPYDASSGQKPDASFEPRGDEPDDAADPHVADESPLFNMRGDATLDSISHASSSQPVASQPSGAPTTGDQTSIQQMVPTAARKRRGRVPTAQSGTPADSGAK